MTDKPNAQGIAENAQQGGDCLSPPTLLISLDYDHVTFDYIVRESCLLSRKFGIGLRVYESSPNHFHIKGMYPIPKDFAFMILKASRCSNDYKQFCLKMGYFPIRNGEKIQYRNGIETDRKPPPRAVFEVSLKETFSQPTPQPR